MTHHPFLMTPGIWLGQGKIQLNLSPEELSFFTRWSVNEVDSDGTIECLQEIQVKGIAEIMQNIFILSNMTNGEFVVDLENEALGKVTGKGIINDKILAWEFRVEEIGFEGFEIYEKQEDKTYKVRAEYATNDQFRTLIQGKLWQKTS